MKKSLNSDGQQFHQYQQNEQSPLMKALNIEKTMTYVVGNAGTCPVVIDEYLLFLRVLYVSNL